MDYLDSIDRQLMLWLNYDGGSVQDQLWWMVSGKFTWIPLYLWLLWLLVLFCRPVKVNWKKLSLLVVITALVVVISDQVASGIIKNVVMRPRPSRPDSGIAEWIHIVNGYRGGHYGFVSSHASNTWGVALWFIFLIKIWLRSEANTLSPTLRRALRITLWALPLWMLLNCYSRIYLGVHYPGDILGGLLVGTMAACIAYYMLYPIGRKWLKLDEK